MVSGETKQLNTAERRTLCSLKVLKQSESNCVVYTNHLGRRLTLGVGLQLQTQGPHFGQ